MGGAGDGDNELGVIITDGDGGVLDVVVELCSDKFECLASSSGTGNKSKSEKSPSSAKAAKISSGRFRSGVGCSCVVLFEVDDHGGILKTLTLAVGSKN